MELPSIFVRRAAVSPPTPRHACSACGRTPLPGEVMHVAEAQADEAPAALCTLCVARAPAAEREAMRAVRVHADDRPLAVVSRAAA